jgi:glycogen phosphorylase
LLESIATFEIPSWGYGMRFDYANYAQPSTDGGRVAQNAFSSNAGSPWEIKRLDVQQIIHFGGRIEKTTYM